jgi:type III secretion protein S
MEYELVIRLTSEALLVCLIVSLPAIVVAAIVGLLVSFVQAVTSLQEQSIGQAAKLISVVVTLLAIGSWGASVVLNFAQTLFTAALR